MELDNCPLALQSNSLNVKNHLDTIENYGLGPADPKAPNVEFWRDKAMKWGVSEGDARGRLCNNCEHYIATTDIKECIANGPAWNIKASELPLDPPWADVEDHPTAFCSLYNITCSPTRTCDSQEMGGPIDDLKMQALKLAQEAEKYDTEEILQFADLTKSSITDTTEDLY